MILESARPRLLAEARPLDESHAGANDRDIVRPARAGSMVLPSELLELAERIAELVIKRRPEGGLP